MAFKKLGDAMRIVVLKAEARRLYLSMHSQYGDFRCGAHLAEFIRPGLAKQRARFNEVMAELATLDPEAKAILEKAGAL